MENEKEKSATETVHAEEVAENVQQEVELNNMSSKDDPQMMNGSSMSDKEESTQKENQAESEVGEESVSDESKPSRVTSEEDSKSKSDDNESDHSDEEEEEIDFEHLDKSEVFQHLEDLKNQDDMKALSRSLRSLKSRYDDLFSEEKSAALSKFLETAGNTEDDFEFKGEELDTKFVALYDQLKTKRDKFFKDQEHQKAENLKIKQQILEDIRQLVDGEESDISINKIREYQDQWKKTGPVPGAQNKTLWANYNALLDRFYDARSIYFELKDLDRKKNLEAKQELCEKAEALDDWENISEAVVQLNELHEEFKHIGPIPKEEQEPVWLRFKAASDKVYIKRRSYVSELKKELHENLQKKESLVESVKSVAAFESDRISEWNKKTKELLVIQEKWNAIGGMPRDKAKQVNKAFWGAFKEFFNKKNAFFKVIDSQREENLKLKLELVEQANELKESKEWDNTARKLKDLQTKWRDIGPVPDSHRNKVYDQFKAACDHFFENRRSQTSQQNQEYEKNYKRKREICDSIIAIVSSGAIEMEKIYSLVDEYVALGFVPRKYIKKINEEFDHAVDSVMQSALINDADKDVFRNNLHFARTQHRKGGSGSGNKKTNSLRRQISTLENDLSTYKTNIDFFTGSKQADILKEEMQSKIDAAETELKRLKRELREIRNS